MAASSQYHRGATTPSSHYQPIASSHEHLYSDIATTWNNSHVLSSRSPPPSALLQRFSLPVTAQRSFPAHGFNYANPPSDYVNNQQQTQASWTANYFRPGPSEWSDGPLGDETYAGRPLSYHDEGARTAPMPHHQHHPSHQHQDATDAAHIVLLPGHQYRPAEHQQQDQLPAQPSAAANAPPFPQQALNSAPVARLLNYPNSDLHASPPHAPSQIPLSWPPAPNTVLSPTSTHPNSSHAGNTLASDVALSNQGTMSVSAWGMLDPAQVNVTLSPAYEQMPGAWSQVHTQPEHLTYMQQPQSVAQSRHVSVAPRGSRTRRAAPKKSVARVPAAFVQRQEKNKISRRQGPLTEASRQKTHQMRKDKTTCLRCRFYKSGCDSGEPCQKCLKTEGNARSFKLPCIRERLEDASLVRHCNGRSNQEEGEFLGYDWASGCQLYDMEIIWNLPGYGQITTSQPMRITFRQYHPQRPFLDITTNMWSNTEGQVKVVEQPPYAVYDTASLIPIFERYFTHLQPAIEQWIFDRVQHDEVALLTYNEVIRLRQSGPEGTRNLLDLVMRIQCLSVVSQGYGTVWSNNIPGIQVVDFGEMGRSDYEAYDRNSRDRPLPGAINHQMDVAALKYLKKLERLCVKELSAMMFKSKIKPWYGLFLALYVLFWNMEYIHRGANKYIMSKNGTAIQTHVSSVVSTQIKKWDWAFQVVIHHWIAVLRGYMPFKLARENPEELREKGHLDPEGFRYVMKVANIFDQIGSGQSTPPFVGQPATHNSLSSTWIKALFKEAGA